MYTDEYRKVKKFTRDKFDEEEEKLAREVNEIIEGG